MRSCNLADIIVTNLMVHGRFGQLAPRGLSMQYVNLGRSGLQVSRVCLGGQAWGSKGHRRWAELDAHESTPLLKRALDLGINYFDTSPTYNDGASEEVLGSHLVGSVPRDELVLQSKVGYPKGEPNKSGLGRKQVLAGIDSTLRRLRTDHIDLYVVHRFDPLTPIEETMTVLDGLVRSGKVRYLGASVMAVRHFIRMQLFAQANGLTPFTAMQNFYNLLYREDERELLPFCAEEGVGVTPYSPLARGLLAGGAGADSPSERAQADEKKNSSFYREHQPAIQASVAGVAAKHGVSNAQVALAWLLQRQAVAAPVVGADRLEHIDEAVSALSVSLTPSDVQALEAAYQPRTPFQSSSVAG